MFRQSIYTLVIISLICSSVAPASAANARPTTVDRRPAAADDAPFRLSDYVVAPDATIELSNRLRATNELFEYDLPAVQQQSPGPYRTTVTLRGNADLARLKKIGVTILASTKTTATVIADRAQLEQLAKLQFAPRQTELTARLRTATRAPLAATATVAYTHAQSHADDHARANPVGATLRGRPLRGRPHCTPDPRFPPEAARLSSRSAASRLDASCRLAHPLRCGRASWRAPD